MSLFPLYYPLYFRQQPDKSVFIRLSNNHHSAGIANTLPKMSSASSSSVSLRLAM